MRRLIASFAVLALLAPAAAVGNAGTAAKARIWLADRSPLVVKGSGFKPHERVVVTAQLGSRYVVRRVATAAGTFTATFTTAGGKVGCNGIAVRAAGARGTVAVLKVPGMECPPPPPVDSAA